MSVVGKYALGVAAMSAVAAFTVVNAGSAAAAESGVAIAEAPGYTAVSRDGGFQAAAGDLYGALALSSKEAVVASAVNYGSWAAASQAALAECGVWDCQIVVEFRNACGAVAQGADYRFGWSWDHSLAAAERSAIDVLGISAPPFPDPGSASPRAASVILSACTANV
ncbi:MULTISPECIES: DUF4189 domain-containing protein [unclassified Nocardia]|uniref:DUF4189 domain-containing protein n=2 Tax=Nocardia TaxID=1817 RepID=UPI001C4E364F|nr:DUF4189 domain-containing protein [Nocardia sp. MH4]